MSRHQSQQQFVEEQLIRAYFLGDLSEIEKERVHERLFTDQDFFDSLLVVEGELVDDYALDLISARERAKLESGFLTSPDQYRQVEFVRTLERYITNNKAIPSDPKAAPSLFTRLLSIFVESEPPINQNVEPSANKNTANEGAIHERILHEAQTNRRLLQSLLTNEWLGLEVLLQFRILPQVTQTDLLALTKRDDVSLRAALSLLIDSGLIEDAAGRYWCSSLGFDILEKLKEAIGHDYLSV